MAGLLPETAGEPVRKAQSSRTWKIDWEQGKLNGMTDGAEAVRQAAQLALMTERFAHVIYSFQYGCELKSLIGKDAEYAAAAAPALAEEALLRDDRVESVRAGEFRAESGALTGSISVIAGGGRLELPVLTKGGAGDADSLL